MTMVIKPKDIIEKISNKKTGEVYANEEDWKAKNVPEADIKLKDGVFLWFFLLLGFFIIFIR